MAKMKKMAMGGMGNPMQSQSVAPQGMNMGVPQPQQRGAGLPLDASKMAAEAAAANAQKQAGSLPPGMPRMGMGRGGDDDRGRGMGRGGDDDRGRGRGFRGDMRGQMPQQSMGLGAMASRLQQNTAPGSAADMARMKALSEAGLKNQVPNTVAPMSQADQMAKLRAAASAAGAAPAGGAMMKKGGAVKKAAAKKAAPVKKMAKGGMTSSASKRADGCAVKGKTKGRYL